MNSLVVLLSVLALATAKPSGILDAGVISYTAPAIATYPAAVSQQSRIDIKSSPTVVSTAAVAPIARTIVAEPTLVAAPAAIASPVAVSSQSRIDIKSSPAVVSTAAVAPIVRTTIAEPAILTAPAAIATPAAISTQSRVDIKSSPAVVSTVAAAAPITYSAPLTAFTPTLIKSAAIAAPISVPTFVKSAAIASPVLYNTAELAAPTLLKTGIVAPSLAAPTVPLDTPEVIAARAAHFEAKARAGAHLIHKRSASLITAPVVSSYSSVPVVSALATSPLVSTYSAPLVLSVPLTKAYSVYRW